VAHKQADGVVRCLIRSCSTSDDPKPWRSTGASLCCFASGDEAERLRPITAAFGAMSASMSWMVCLEWITLGIEIDDP
jgi:hypothetical protein